jgi:chemotaxis protein CheX
MDQSSNGPTADRLPQVLDFAHAGRLRDAMIFAFANGPVLLDASDVERMSTPAAQVMLAAGRASDASHIDFQIVNPSEAFRNGLIDLGLEAEFKHWMD